MTTVAMNNLWNYIAGLNLSQRNRAWLAEQLVSMPKKKAKASEKMNAYTVEELRCRAEEGRKQIAKGKYYTTEEVLAMCAEAEPENKTV